MGLLKRQIARGLLAVLATSACPLGTAARAGELIVGGLCAPTRDPMAGDGPGGLTPAGCVQGTAGAEAVVYAERQGDAVWLDYGSVYAGAFITPWFSAHVLGRWRDIKGLRNDTPEVKDLYTDYAVVEVGSPVLSRFRFTAGHLRLPFGVDQSEAPQFYQALENRLLWHSPHTGAYLTYDDLRRLRFDLGLAVGDSLNHPHRPDEEAQLGAVDRAMSARAMWDISALEGTRLLLSGYAAQLGERRFGFGMINVNHKSDTTEFEFVRRLSTPTGRAQPFEQVLRLSYAQAWQGPRRWVVQFDDERLRFRRIVVDFDYEFFKRFVLRTSIGYRQRSDGLSRASRTSLGLGLEAKL